MDTEDINSDRRHFFGTAMLTLAAGRLGLTRFTKMPLAEMVGDTRITHTPPDRGRFDSIKQIDAGVLNVGYVDAGPANGPAVVLLHGWPYDIESYVEVASLLAASGYRAIVPYLRGFGRTRFLSDETFRNGEQAALALDVIALMDALEI